MVNSVMQLKNKKEIVIFISQFWLYISQFWVSLRTVRYKLRIVRKSQNCQKGCNYFLSFSFFLFYGRNNFHSPTLKFVLLRNIHSKLQKLNVLQLLFHVIFYNNLMDRKRKILFSDKKQTAQTTLWNNCKFYSCLALCIDWVIYE